MVVEWVEWQPSPRDELITQVRYGKITPEQAEAEAAARGWEKLASEPEPSEFDPLQESRWSIAMAIIWIAWRNLDLVREQNPDFRAASLAWFIFEWNAPAEDGSAFVSQRGWLLETWKSSTVPRLSLLEQFLESKGELPSTSLRSVTVAEKVLCRALSEGRLTAEGLDHNGSPVDIPSRDWSYLTLVEERERDVLKYSTMDLVPAFTQVKLKRDDLVSLWSQKVTYEPVNLRGDYLIDCAMVEPVESRHDRAYVPLCAAIHWIMTAGASKQVMLNDEAAWDSATQKLFALIHNNEIPLIGLPHGGALPARIPGHALTLIKVLPPTPKSLENPLLRDPHILCCSYMDEQQWSKFNDQLFETDGCSPAWTHLQVLKDGVLKRQPRPPSMLKPERECCLWLELQIRQSPDLRPKNKDGMFEDAKLLFHGLKRRQFDRAWSKAVIEPGIEAWSKSGPLPSSSVQSVS